MWIRKKRTYGIFFGVRFILDPAKQALIVCSLMDNNAYMSAKVKRNKFSRTAALIMAVFKHKTDNLRNAD